MKIEPRLTTASALHRKVHGLVKALFPQMTVFENAPVECPIRGRKTTLFVDLLVKELGVAIECHGRQHFEYVEHFHRSRHGFTEAQERDRAKAQSVQEAGIAYCIVRWDEEKTITPRMLLKRITAAIKERP